MSVQKVQKFDLISSAQINQTGGLYDAIHSLIIHLLALLIQMLTWQHQL